MAKLTTLAVIAAAAVTTLAACSVTPPNRPPSIVTNEVPYQPGMGTVQAVTQTPVLAVAGAGASSAASSTSEPLKRLHVRMDNGRTQYIDTVSSVRPGARVELTPDRKIRTL
jgi:type IV pilus biogenesis protein CpaD/CtpE